MVQDEVDRLIEAWRRERPDLDVSPLALSRITRLAAHLDGIRRDAFTDHDLEIWEFDVLAALRRSGHPYQLSAGQLTAQTHVTSGTMTNRLDRLEQRGLIGRMRSAQDGRSVTVTLTPEGRDAVDGALSNLLTRERAVLQGLTAEQGNDLAELLRTLLSRFA